ncbi:MAG TPA: glycosyltransferase family 39 protein [Devosiaceae bacterium]|nr:glycosyltransferase family 39 protein [Devosiaceae bacterium]
MAPVTRDSEQPVWLGLPAVAAVVILLTLLKLYVGARSGLVFDEGYYTFWSERLAVGYLDHPPAVAWMIAAGRGLLGDNSLGVRLFASLFGLGISAAIWRIGTLLIDRRTAALAVLLYNLTPAAGLGFITTPDPPSVLCWVAVTWAIAEFTVSRRADWWLVAGVLAGLGLWSKYTDAFLAPGLLLFLLVNRERRGWLKLWQVWAAIPLALLVFSPVIWWNAQRDWASFRFQGQRTVTDGIDPHFFGNFGDYLGGQALYMVPILLLFTLGGIVLFFRKRNDPRWSSLALPVWTTLPALAYFTFHTLHARVEANWLIPLWPSLALVGTVTVLALWDRRPRLMGALLAVQVALGLGLMLTLYAQTLWQPFNLGGADRTSETRGWAGMEHDLSGLAAANGAHWIATSANFGLTGELASAFLFAKSRLPVRQIDEAPRWGFLPPTSPDALGWPALFVSQSADPPSASFGQAKLVGTVTRSGGKWPLESYSVFLVSAPTAKFRADFPG